MAFLNIKDLKVLSVPLQFKTEWQSQKSQQPKVILTSFSLYVDSITYQTYTKNDSTMWKYLMCKEKSEKEQKENGQTWD